MKQLWIIGAFTVCLLATGCDGNRTEQDRPEKITDEPLKQKDTEQDTTLQEVEELTIKAVGGEEMQTMSFDQDTLQVKAGSLVRLELINEGKDPKMIYNIVFTKEGHAERAAREGTRAGASGNYLPESSILLAASPLALPGQTVEMEFTAPNTPGTYDFVNTYPSDYKQMKGILVVK
jgi:azurin